MGVGLLLKPGDNLLTIGASPLLSFVVWYSSSGGAAA